MKFEYIYLQNNEEQKGEIEAATREAAISVLQGRGLTLISLESIGANNWFEKYNNILHRVSPKDVVILSRQIATLFRARVSPLKIFQMLSTESVKPGLRDVLNEVSEDIRAGLPMSEAMAKHERIFSAFYVNMVRAGEESGKLSEVFGALADYLDRNYKIVSKVKGALIYPAFVVTTFFGVMILMLRVVIPNISKILIESGGELPVYTKFVLNLSNLFVHYGFHMLVVAIGVVIGFRFFAASERGKIILERFKLGTPVIGGLYRKLYLTRIADNMDTMLSSGVSMTRSLENTTDVVNSVIFRDILEQVTELVRGGSSLAEAFSQFPELPSILTQMVRVGEETGELGGILKTLADFYRGEVENAVDGMVALIEPAMIVLLGLGVGFLLASVLMPIYNISANIA